MVPSSLSSFGSCRDNSLITQGALLITCFSALNITEQSTLFHAADLRTDENVTSEAFCSEVRYNNNPMAHDFDSSGYLEPGDGVSQLGLAAAIPEFGNFGTEIASNHWAEPHFQVFSLGPKAV